MPRNIMACIPGSGRQEEKQIKIGLVSGLLIGLVFSGEGLLRGIVLGELTYLFPWAVFLLVTRKTDELPKFLLLAVLPAMIVGVALGRAIHISHILP